MLRSAALPLLLVACQTSTVATSSPDAGASEAGVEAMPDGGPPDAGDGPRAHDIHRDAIARLPELTPRRWPARVARHSSTEVLARYAEHHSIANVFLVDFAASPTDEAEGVLVLRGVGPDGPFERAAFVRDHYGNLVFEDVTRAERHRRAAYATVPERDAYVDELGARYATCASSCATARYPSICPGDCDDRARFALHTDDVVFASGEIRVTTDMRSHPRQIGYRVTWGERSASFLEVGGGPVFRRVRIDAGHPALYAYLTLSGGHRVFVRRDDRVDSLRGRSVHDFEAPTPWEGWSGHRHGWSQPPSDEADRELRFPGDGTIRRVVHEGAFCRRSERSTDASSWEWWRGRRSEVVMRLDDARHRITSTHHRAGRWGECYEELVAACPFVDVAGADGEWARVGEVLRNVRYDDETQALALPAASQSIRRVRLSEEKHEVTHLDAVHLEVNGIAIAPTSCRGSAPPAYCEVDGRPWVMHQGDTLELVFETDAPGSADLVATGHYRPHVPL